MKTKTKRFSHKLLALFMALVMGLTCFSGALSSFAASSDVTYYDGAVEYNDLAWPVLSDEQTATALLDYLDTILADVGPSLDKTIGNAITNLNVGVLKWDANNRKVLIKAFVVNDEVSVHLHSVDEILDTLESAAGLISRRGNLIGDAKNIKLDTTAGMQRSNTSSCDILRGLIGILRNNSHDTTNGKDVIGEFLRGGFDLGTVGSLAKLDIYEMLRGGLNLDSGYQSNFVYNLVQGILFNNTNWFSADEKTAYKANPSTFVYDDVLIEKLNSKFLRDINAEITYKATTGDGQTESSRDRYKAIMAYIADHPDTSFAAASDALGYDPHLVYTDDGNVRLFQYDTNLDGVIDESEGSTEVITLGKTDSLFAFGYQALDFAWKTALRETISTLRVNYSVERGHGTNFDNSYYYWAKGALDGGWDTSNLAAMYSQDNLNAWANHKVKERVTNFGTASNPTWVVGAYSDEDVALGIEEAEDGAYVIVGTDRKVTLLPSDIAVTTEKESEDSDKTYTVTETRKLYEVYSAADKDEFLGWVRNNYEFDRDLIPDSTGSWSDIDPKTLFTKLRYSPLADYGFNMTTGPLNLYFMQTGTSNLNAFFDSYKDNYTSLVSGINDALVAAVKDIFIDRADRSNVYGGENASAYPALKTTKEQNIARGTIDATAINGIVSTFVGNATQVIQYTADAIDSNILKAFYDANGTNAKITEGNIEGAMMPLIIACVGRVNLNGHKLAECIHPEDFDGCKDVEALAFVALREYLSYILPNNDYNALASVAEDGTITATLNGTLLPMARDAVSYVMQGYVPVSYKTGNGVAAWDVYTMGGVNADGTLKNSASLFELLNSVVCYYAGEHSYTNSNVAYSKGSMAVGALIGICGEDGRSQIVMSNTLWENFNIIADKLVPMLAVLQGTSNGKFDSEELIWNNVVESLVNIGSTNGATTILTKLLSIVSAAPIQSESIVYVIYDLAEQFFNGLLGARQSGMTAEQPVPKRGNSAHPFDDLLQVGSLAGTSGSNIGTIQKLLCNFAEFSGFGEVGGKNSVSAFNDSIIRGLMFAVKAVQSFLPNVLTTIGDHKLGMATALYDKTTVDGLSQNGSATVSLTFTNNSVGVNNAYVTQSGVKQIGRYYMIIKDTDVDSSGTSSLNGGWSSTKRIAPGESVTLTGTSAMSGNSSTVIATITYDIVEKDKNGNERTVASDVQVKAYQFISAEKGWRDFVYPASRVTTQGVQQFTTELEAQQEGSGTWVIGKKFPENRTYTSNGYNGYTSSSFNNLVLNYPQYLVLTTSNPWAIQEYQFRVCANSKKSVDGFYCYDIKSGLKNDITGATNVSVNMDNAIPVYDKRTGGIIKYGRQDALIYSIDEDGTATFYKQDCVTVAGTVEGYSALSADDKLVAQDPYWDRGTVWGHFESGTDEGTGALGINEITNLANEKGLNVQTRDHIAYTVEELQTNGMLQAYHKNAAGIVEYLYIKPGNDGYHYDTVFGQINLRGPVDGIYLAQGKMENVESGKSRYTTDLFKYDGYTQLEAGTYDVKLCAYNSTKSGTTWNSGRECYLVIGNDDAKGQLEDKFEEITEYLSQYQEGDFANQTVLEKTKTAVTNALSTMAAPVTPDSALALSDKSYLAESTQTVATQYGDRAYVPYTSSSETERPSVEVDGRGTVSMPIKVMSNAYWSAGIWYYDKDCTMPIYSPKPLTSAANDTLTTDPAGKAVIRGTGNDADKYYLKNAPLYDMEWIEGSTTVRPYQQYKLDDAGNKIQSKDNKGNKLYTQVTYVYRDTAANKVNSDFVWDCKFPATETRCLYDETTGSTVNYRGDYTAERDSLIYWTDQIKKAVNAAIAQSVVSDISLVRQGMNNNNFEVLTYNKMVELAKKAEKGYSFTFDYIKNGKTEHAKEEGFADFMKYVNNDENKIIGLTKNDDGTLTIDYSKITLNSSLSSIEVKEFKALFDTYMKAVVERGYNGVQIEKEIACAAGNNYDAFGDVTKAVWEKDAKNVWHRTSEAEINVTSATDVPFGAVENGKLVNNGAIVYDAGLWGNYTEALANALAIAQEANSTYAHKTSALYVPADKENYTCQVTDAYSADTALQTAEIALENAKYVSLAEGVEGGTVTVDGITLSATQKAGVPSGYEFPVTATANEGYEFAGFAEPVYEKDGGNAVYVKYTDVVITPTFIAAGPSGYDVTLSVEIAANVSKGTSTGIPVYGTYNIKLYSDEARTQLVTEADSETIDGANMITLANLADGTYYATMTSDYMIPLNNITIVVNGANIESFVVPVVPCDLNQDGAIGVDDAKKVILISASGQNDPLYEYSKFNEDAYVAIDDAKVVVAFMVNSSMPALTVANN